MVLIIDCHSLIKKWAFPNVANTDSSRVDGTAVPVTTEEKGPTNPHEVGLNLEDERMLRMLTKNMINKKWEMMKVCLNIIDDQEEIVKKMTEKEKVKENVGWNVDERDTMKKLRLNNIRYLNLKNGTRNGEKNVLEDFCRKKGVTEKKEDWRRNFEDEIKKKEREVEEIKKKKLKARSKKRRLELLRDCQEHLRKMIVDGNENPKEDEELKFEEWKKKIVEMKKLKKKNPKVEAAEDEEEVKTITQLPSVEQDRAEHLVAITTNVRKPTRVFSNFTNLHPKLEAAKVSGQGTKPKIFTKPQHVYGSILTLDRVDSDCTSVGTNGRGVCGKTGPPGQ